MIGKEGKQIELMEIDRIAFLFISNNLREIRH